MLFSYFEVLHEEIIDKEAGMRGTAVKCGKRPLLGERYMKFTQGSPSLSSKISDKNRRENQIKTRWERSGRHNEIGMECWKYKDVKRCCGEVKNYADCSQLNPEARGEHPAFMVSYLTLSQARLSCPPSAMMGL